MTCNSREPLNYYSPDNRSWNLLRLLEFKLKSLFDYRHWYIGNLGNPTIKLRHWDFIRNSHVRHFWDYWGFTEEKNLRSRGVRSLYLLYSCSCLRETTEILKRSNFLFTIPMALVNHNRNMWEEEGWNKKDVRRRT